VRYKQGGVIELVVAKKESVRNIHKHLCNIYGSDTVDRNTVGHGAKRVTASDRGKAEFQDLPHSGCPVTTVCPEMLQRTDAIVHGN
jgi:hypothetical protein